MNYGTNYKIFHAIHGPVAHGAAVGDALVTGHEGRRGLCLLHVIELDADVLLRQPAFFPPGQDLRPEH